MHSRCGCMGAWRMLGSGLQVARRCPHVFGCQGIKAYQVFRLDSPGDGCIKVAHAAPLDRQPGCGRAIHQLAFLGLEPAKLGLELFQGRAALGHFAQQGLGRHHV